MNKSELIEAIAERAEISLAKAESTLKAMLEGITHTLKKGDEISLVGFGRFGVKKRAARKGRNPQTGAVINIKAAKVPFFKAGKQLKDAVDSGKK